MVEGKPIFKNKIEGKPGHVAYPHLANNPLYYTSKIANDLYNIKLNKKAKNFPITNLEITSIDTGNKASNVIPAETELSLNIRFNKNYTEKDLLSKINNVCKKYKDKI